jgi:hypothetical protein
MLSKGIFWVACFLALAISFCPAATAGDNDREEIKKIASASTDISKIKQVNVEIVGNTALVAVWGKILSREVDKKPQEIDALQDLVMSKTGDKWQIVAKDVDLLDFKQEPFYKDMPEEAKQAFEKFLCRGTFMMGTWIYSPTEAYEGRLIFQPDGTFSFAGWESPKFKSRGTWQAGRDSVKLTFLDNQEYWKKTFAVSFPSGKTKERYPNIRSFAPKTLTVEFEIERHVSPTLRYHFINFLGWNFIKTNK